MKAESRKPGFCITTGVGFDFHFTSCEKEDDNKEYHYHYFFSFCKDILEIMKRGQFPLTFSHTKKMIEESRLTRAERDELKEQNTTLKKEVKASMLTESATALFNEVKADKERMKGQLKNKDKMIVAA